MQGVDFGVTSILGVVSLMGIIVRNGIIMIDYAEELRKTEKLGVRDAIYHSARRRMRVLEATPGFEPGRQSFADSCLTTWLCRRILSNVTQGQKSIFLRCMAYSAFLRNTRHNRRYLRIFPPYICRTDNRIYDWCPFVNLRCKAYSFGI